MGRANELRVLDETFNDARSGRGRAVFIIGEDGIGRTRLAVEAGRRAAEAGLRVLRGRGSPIGPPTPLRPLTEAVLSLLRGTDPPDVTPLGPYLPALGRLVPDWSSKPTDPGGESPIILAEALLRLAATAGDGRGCLIVIDDLQDADSETLAVVEYIADNVGDQPVVLLATIRDEPGLALDLAQFAGRRHACTILEPAKLTREDVRHLVATLLGGADTLPEPTLQRLWLDGGGNPLITEELLLPMVSGGRLSKSAPTHPSSQAWDQTIRRGLGRTVTRRLGRLSPQAINLLSVSAIFGTRFPLEVTRAVAGLDAYQAEREVHDAIDLHVLQADLAHPGWYSFAQPYVSHTLLAQLPPASRVELAARAAVEIETLHPGLPDEWCEIVAVLRADAGDRAAAGEHFVQAGRRAMDTGDLPVALDLLERGRQVLAVEPDPMSHARAADQLVRALVEAGCVARADAIAATVPWSDCTPAMRGALHVRFAWLALTAGRYADGLTHVETARAVLGADATAGEAASIDAVAAHLLLESGGSDPYGMAEVLGRRAAAAIDLDDTLSTDADPASVDVMCQLWHVLGLTARRRDTSEAVTCFIRMRRLASEKSLTYQWLRARYRLASETALRDGDPEPLRQAYREIEKFGAVTLRHQAASSIALHDILAGRYRAATANLDGCQSSADELGLGDAARDLLVVRAVLVAHQGRRRELDDTLRTLRDTGTDQPRHLHMLHGLAGVFCGLLLEDHDRSRTELDSARTVPVDLDGGWQGIGLLLDALDERLAVDALDKAATGVAMRSRWNHRFVLLAGAVLHGRSGDPERAGAAFDAADTVAAVYPMARHLGRRLVAEAAMRDRWGDPRAWLREAEDYFHTADVPAPAAACRSLLRQIGEPIRQRRDGSTRVPTALRSVGVTVREYDVLLLLGERLNNRSIAERLHISPRTVEKHVASLLGKTGVAGRDALHDVAPATRGEDVAPPAPGLPQPRPGGTDGGW